MSVTIRGSDILFNDGTTQSTAAGVVNTTTVLNATAGAGAGAVGTYALMKSNNGTAVSVGNQKAGSDLRFAGAWTAAVAATIPSGAWLCMGNDASTVGGTRDITLWLRLS